MTTHHLAELFRTNRAVERKAHELPMEDLPYPGSRSDNSQHTTTNNTGGLGWFLGPLLGAGLAGIGGLGMMALMPKPTTPPAVVTPTTPPLTPTVASPAPLPALQPYEFDEIEQVQQADGNWVNTGKTTRKRLNPDGTTQTKQPDGTWR